MDQQTAGYHQFLNFRVGLCAPVINAGAGIKRPLHLRRHILRTDRDPPAADPVEGFADADKLLPAAQTYISGIEDPVGLFPRHRHSGADSMDFVTGHAEHSPIFLRHLLANGEDRRGASRQAAHLLADTGLVFPIPEALFHGLVGKIIIVSNDNNRQR